MTTDFRRAQASVERVEQLVTDLLNTKCPAGFPFYPRPRAEVATVEDDWVVVGSRSAIEVRISPEQRTKFQEVEKQFSELEPLIERLRRRCIARSDFEASKELLRWHLEAARGSSSSNATDSRQLFAESQALIDEQGDGHEEVKVLLAKTIELEASATYGTKMVEQVLDLLARHDAAHGLFNTDVAPSLGAAVATEAASDEVWQRVSERRLTAEAEEEARRCQAEAWRPILALLAASEQRQQEVLEAHELSEWQCAQPIEERLRLCPSSECSQEAGSLLPSVMWMYS
jgi:hypothetical protein